MKLALSPSWLLVGLLSLTTTRTVLADVECHSVPAAELPDERTCWKIANRAAVAHGRDSTVYTWGRHFRNTATTRKLPATWDVLPDTPGHGTCVFTLDVLDTWSPIGAEGRFSTVDVAWQMRRIIKRCLSQMEGPRTPKIGFAR